MTTSARARPRCSPPATSSTAPSLAAACSATGTRSSSASSTPSRHRSRPARSSTSSSTTTPPTSSRRRLPGSPATPALPSTSPRPRAPGSTPSRPSSPHSPSGAETRRVPIGRRPPGRYQPLSRRLIAANAAALELYRQALDRHRGKGQQQITVKHVTVNADQAVVADTVVGGSKGPVEISNDGHNAPLLLEARHAPGLALQGAFEKEREAVPLTRRYGLGRVSHARGSWRRAERQGERQLQDRRTRPSFAKREGLSAAPGLAR